MAVNTIKIGKLSVSKFILGGNPFSGFSHQNSGKDLEMKRYYKVERIKDVLKQAEKLGISTFLGRADHHIIRMLLEYWDEGGKIQWIAQTCPGVGDVNLGIFNAFTGRAKACYIHGGQMDFFLAQNKLENLSKYITSIRNAGMIAGVAGHNPQVFEWAENNLDVDFYMCSYYNPTKRTANPKHDPTSTEYFNPKDREKMVNLIQTLNKPVIHYKILGAGRNEPKKAFKFVAQYLRPQDAVCVGIYTKNNPKMLEEDLKLFENAL
ncbi:MAG: hypothetical protein ACTSWY_03820 [Promethearchaeota archaeon]